MFSKIVRIGLPIVLVGIILLIAHNTYQKANEVTSSPISVIPNNASIILQINEVEKLGKLLAKYNIWDKLQKIQEVKDITNKAIELSDFFIVNQTLFNSNSLFISFHKVSAKKIASLFSISFNRESINDNKDIVMLFSNDIMTSEYDNQTIYYSESLNKYFSFKDDILFYSKNRMLITDAIRTSDENTDDLFVDPIFSGCYKTISNSSEINLMLNYNNLIDLTKTFTTNSSEATHFSEWIATDLRFKDNAILSSGLSILSSQVKDFTDIFTSQKNQKLKILDILPTNTTYLFATSFNDQQDIYNKKNTILQNKNEFWNWDKNRKEIAKQSNVNYNEFINEIDKEAGVFNTSSSLKRENDYSYFSAKESIRAGSLLQGMILSSVDYKNYRINKIADNNLTANLFGHLFTTNNEFFITINDYFIFGNSIASLEYIIDNYKSKRVLTNNKSFKRFRSYISNDANIFFYINPGKIAENLKNNLIDEELLTYNADSITKFTSLSLQINTTRNEMLHNLCLFYDEKYKESIKEQWHYTLDTNSSINPQFVYNHFTKEKMIIIQDQYNNIVALDGDGERLWSKQIESSIIGEVNFIDYYKNNKFQALFNTSSKLYLLDRNGDFVDGFPKKLPAPTSIGHALFDYDKNKNYRIIIVGDDNKLYNLDKKGAKVAGWKYRNTNIPNITQKPIHFIARGKDYILQTSNDITKLLARNGTERTVFENAQSFNTPVNISKEGYLYAITSEGKIWNGYVDGTSEVNTLTDLQVNSKILKYNGGYYIGNGNIVSYVNNSTEETITITLDNPIQTLSLHEEYIAITTHTSLYLIDENKVVEGFPVDFERHFNISDIDNNGKVNVINIKNGLVYNYEIAD